MADDDNRRLVSGEIMAAATAMPARRSEAMEFVDAEYETLAPDPSLGVERRPVERAAAPGGMSMLRGVGGHVERAARGGPVFWTVGLFLVALAFWVSGGHMLIDRKGATVAATQRQPLAIDEVRSRVQPRGERDVLFVEGATTNYGTDTLAVPPIAIAITDGKGLTSRHFLGTNGALLAPGQSIGFSSRVEAPSNGVKSVTVTFREE